MNRFSSGGRSRSTKTSEKTAVDIDDEVRRIVIDAYTTAKNLLAENRDILDAFAQALLERETMDGAEIDELIREAQSRRAVSV